MWDLKHTSSKQRQKFVDAKQQQNHETTVAAVPHHGSNLRPRAAQRRPSPSSSSAAASNNNTPSSSPSSVPKTVVYHRHYKHHMHDAPFLYSTSPRGSKRPSRLALVLPVLLFSSFLGMAFFQPPPSSNVGAGSGGGRPHFIEMLDASRLRRQQRRPTQPQQRPRMTQVEEEEEEEEDDDESNDSPNKLEKDGNVDIAPPSSDRDPTLTGDANNKQEQSEALADTVDVDAGEARAQVSQRSPSQPQPIVLTLDAVVEESESPKVLTLYLQQHNSSSLSPFHQQLESKEFPIPRSKLSPQATNNACSQLLPPSLFLPIDNFPSEDAYLPWIHDYWYVPPAPSHESAEGTTNGGRIQFVAQNRRRCQTGKGREAVMKHWEPQMALFQSIPINLFEDKTNDGGSTSCSVQIANSVDNATIPETRFLCHFTSSTAVDSHVTFSRFNFNYEYVLYRKRDIYKGMFVESGRDVQQFELSQLLFSCPVPSNVVGGNDWFLDLIPIRTHVRQGEEMLLTPAQVGEEQFRRLISKRRHGSILNDKSNKAPISVSQLVRSTGRWANLPVCLDSTKKTTVVKKPNNFVLCTWTAANYYRRGDATSISDSARRLREWVAFHQLVGVDHVYIYDNTQPPNGTDPKDFVSPLQSVTEKYFSAENVTYVPWPCRVCSNNRPNHPNPGERSSQYAAEASCRERFGSSTEWMAFIDQDEYLVPMMKGSADPDAERLTSWTPVLEKKRNEGHHVLKMRSSRGRPRVSLMETIVNDTESVCVVSSRSRFQPEQCIRPPKSQTFLKVYNCEYIRPPKPDRFQRAMKQIYRPAFVKSHYVHYSTITEPMTRYYNEYTNSTSGRPKLYSRAIQGWEWGDTFLDDLNEGCLVHAKSVLPHETIYRSSICQLGSKQPCVVGFECPDTTPFDDKTHTKNIAKNEKGEYCNCWINHHLEDTLIPKLEAILQLPRD